MRKNACCQVFVCVECLNTQFKNGQMTFVLSQCCACFEIGHLLA